MFDEENIFLPPTFENYLKSIWKISQEKGIVRVKDLADSLGLKGGTVVSGLKNLAKKGLVLHGHYGHIELTQAGKVTAMQILQKHNVLYDFLKNGLKIESVKAEKDACVLEHYITKETYHRLIHFLEYIKEKLSLEDLHKFLEEKINPPLLSLSQLEEESLAVIKNIEAPKNIKQKLMDLGILPQKEIFLEKKALFGEPLEIILGSLHISLRKDEADTIFVVKKDTIKLIDVSFGNYYISFIKASPNVVNKLKNLGLFPGKVIEVLGKEEDNIFLKVDENKLVLNESVASSIYLEMYHDKV